LRRSVETAGQTGHPTGLPIGAWIIRQSANGWLIHCRDQKNPDGT
jgi:hypothetical protein